MNHHIDPAKEKNTRSRQEYSVLFFHFLIVPKGDFSNLAELFVSRWKHPTVTQQPEEESLTCNSGNSKLGRALSRRRLRGADTEHSPKDRGEDGWARERRQEFHILRKMTP